MRPEDMCIAQAQVTCKMGALPNDWNSPMKINKNGNQVITSCSQLVDCSCQNNNANCSIKG
jgi:hypothetical protein